MTRASIPRRLDRLEHLTLKVSCRRCAGHPTRFVGLDPDTDAVTSETIPESGCPECGSPPVRTIAIAGVDVSQF